MANKITRRVSEQGGDLSFGKKPLRMHHATYKALCKKVHVYTNKSDEALKNDIAEWFGLEKATMLDIG
jgi:hypothetical protein